MSGTKSKTWLGVLIPLVVFAIFATPVILCRYKPIKISPKHYPSEFEYVSSNPVLFWIFLSLFFASIVGLVLWIALRQRKSV